MTSRPDQEKVLELNGSTYRIKKFTPEIACYWAMRLFGDILGGLSSKTKFTPSQMTKLIDQFTKALTKDREQFESFQRDCLSFVMVKFESGLHPLVNSEGFLTQTDLPSPSVFALTIHSFMHSMSDFLDPSLLGNLLGAAVPADTTAAPKTT